MSPQERTGYLLAEARAHDRHRYLAALFAPAERRDAVLALILLGHELAKVPEVAREPMTGYIRYQWWRDALGEAAEGGPPRAHPVAVALAEALRQGWLAPEPLQGLVDAREQELAGPPEGGLAALEGFAAATDGRLQELVLAALGGGSAAERAAARDLGTALGLLAAVRAAGRRRPRLPPGLLSETGADPRDLAAGRMSASLGRAVTAVLGRAEALLADARRAAGRPERRLMAAFLPARLASAEARQLRRLDGDPYRAALAARSPAAPLALLVSHLLRRP